MASSVSGSDGRLLFHDNANWLGALEQEDFVAALISAAADTERFDDRSAHPIRARGVQLALDYMRHQAQEGISISDLCDATGVSWRTLDRGFRETFGIGPKAYLNRLRLGRARSDLLRYSKDLSVADAANAWGFWHMGQFAKDYRAMFGELPSATLKV